ncbi:hypothetical protein HPB50_003027 [Hyalomma asiaticum]|uniref:Uncharacterized protein n=1 Tax=Hyalomma asiaticum TaxID=266040 RepID=A0ACB7RTX4_HYAAI|nr:hypothetical protein HPB50_003027 [Hyalomma asiaticum]
MRFGHGLLFYPGPKRISTKKKKDILRLVRSLEGVAAVDAEDDTEESEAPVPTPRVTEALDLLRQFVGIHEGTEDALSALQTCEKSRRSLLTKREQAKIIDFFAEK